MKTCLVITDSVGFPRETPLTLFKDTWLGLMMPKLNQAGYIIYTFQKKGLDSNRVVAEIKDHLIYIKPDIFLLQIGIVDCSPRALKESELKFINKIPLIRNLVKIFVKKYYQKISAFRNISYVDRKQFEDNMNSLKFSFSNSLPVIIPIGKPNDAYLRKSPLICARIEDYNQILKKIFGSKFLENYLLKSNLLLEKIYTEDHYHLNKVGHDFLYHCLLEEMCHARIINN